MSVTVLRAENRVAKLWKNGGGVTRDVCAWPPGAGVEAFDWRISIADVDSDGPFSLFPDVDRILTILSGNGLHLMQNGGIEEGRDAVTLTSMSTPYAFSGDAATMGILISGSIRDLNVMVKRNIYVATVERVSFLAPSLAYPEQTDGASPHVWILLWLSGNANFDTPDRFIPSPLDAVMGEKHDQVQIYPETPCEALLVSLRPAL